MSRTVLTTDQFNSWVTVPGTLSGTLKFTSTSVVSVTLALLLSIHAKKNEEYSQHIIIRSWEKMSSLDCETPKKRLKAINN